MAKINNKSAKTKSLAVTPIQTTFKDTKTFEGAPAWSRDPKSDLFLMGVTTFFGEDTFYEKKDDRGARFISLVQSVAATDPAWIGKFLPWLRRTANIRTAALVGAVEAGRVLASPNQVGMETGPARELIRLTITRADEPAEVLAYWLTTYGRRVPGWLRRGVSDAAARLYTERNFIKWDSDRSAVRMSDVLSLTHPRSVLGQGDLFKYILDAKRRTTEVPTNLTMLRNRERVLKLDAKGRETLLGSPNVAQVLSGAGLTWEQVSSWGKFTAKTWEALIPDMGYMALLRNLRNFQDTGVSDKVKKQVAMRLGDPTQVATSRQLPFRFYSAYLEATHPVWALGLETALQFSTQNLPELPGSTLVLVDTSGSMTDPMSSKSKVTRMAAGALFGISLAVKGADVRLYGFADRAFRHPIGAGVGVLRETEKFLRRSGEAGHGTQIALSLQQSYHGEDRVVIVTDEQTFGVTYYQTDVTNQIPAHIPIYAFNTSGYAPAMMESGSKRHSLGGLTDHTFSMINMLEQGQSSSWPWEA